MITIGSISQEEFERLLEESRGIAEDMDTYVQFCRNRDAILQEIMLQQGRN